MAITTDPRAIAFANSKVRVFADLARSHYWTAKSFLAAWVALGGPAAIPNTSAVFADGASLNGTDATGGDGRTLMTGAEMWNLVNYATSIVNFVEGSAQVAAGDGSKAILSQVEAIRVNGLPVF